MGINYTDELASLVLFAGNTALAIRQYSAYSADATHASRAARDFRWLSDSLHNFEAIGRSVLQANHAHVAFMAGLLAEQFQKHLQTDPSDPESPAAAFKRNARYVDLHAVIATLLNLQAKAAAAVEETTV
ncbi:MULTISPECIES: hypothetical protein [Xanthomonas]|uniref:hypothetical protein n=1 Tax=Xanthomonas TaxID=338 RepID=UPI000949E895|nr:MULTISPECIES: hypothetical protein [Xanthomonas]MBV6791711.1 hypothetical protein [Xanthomonas campestris pv. clerodendri]WJS66076.1 hypothetical protein DXO206_023325 [Xanthomonas oryzae pv. oryzae]